MKTTAQVELKIILISWPILIQCRNIRLKQTEESHKVFLSDVISGQYSKAVLPQHKLED